MCIYCIYSICSFVLMSKPFFCLKVELLSILLKKTQKYLDYSEGMFIFGFAEDTFANYVFLCHDSAKHASMMALAAPSVRKNKKKQDFLWFFPHLIVSLHCQNESFDYAAECGEQGLIDTAPFKSHHMVAFIF